MIRNRAEWSDDDDQRLRTFVDTGRSIADIARALQRSPAAVSARGRRLGLKIAEPRRAAYCPLRRFGHRGLPGLQKDF